MSIILGGVLSLLASFSQGLTVPRSGSPLQANASAIAPSAGKAGYGKVLLYVTTQMSQNHEAFLNTCWPKATAASKLLRNSDVLVYVTGPGPDAELLERAFPHADGSRSVQVKMVRNPGYHEGAMLAMAQAMREGWFEGYDWVVRLNPDVILRDEAPLLEALGGSGIDGVFINCHHGWGKAKVQTDFFAMRPDRLPADAFKEFNEEKCSKLDEWGLKADAECNAEWSATQAFSEILEDRSRFVWLKGAGPPVGTDMCRVTGPTVIHNHTYISACDGDEWQTWGSGAM